jgi:hypothetical protein
MQVGVRRHVIATLLSLTLGSLALSAPAGADDAALPALATPTGQAVVPGPTTNPAVVRSRAVTVAADLLPGLQPGDRLALELFDDLSVVMVVETAGASGAWSGTIAGDPPGTFTLVSGEEGTAAVLRVPGQGTYRIRPRAAGSHVLEQLDATALPPCGGAPVRELPAGGAARAGDCDDGSVIDLLVVYTPVAAADAEGAGVIETLVTLAVSNGNYAYGESLITPRLNLVSMQEIEYYEDGSYSQHLNRLTDTNDGYMDEVHDLRDQYSADMVALIVADNEYCGLAWLMQNNDASFASMAFSVTSWFCLEFQTLAHELGHNQGCCHAPGDGGGCYDGGLYDYSVGYRYTGDSGQLWRTIMAYEPGTRIDHFSNPDVDFDGEPTGVPINQPDRAHNALTINQTALTVANFRCRPPLMNDLCADALPIFDGDTFVDTTDANTDGPAHAGCGVAPDGGQTFHDIWYVYTASCTGELTVSTCNQAAYDTDLVVYDGTDCGNLQFLGCNEDAAGCAGNSSELTVPVVQGNDYLVRVGGWFEGDMGAATVTISCTVPTGACCLADAGCAAGVTQSECEGTLAGTYLGHGSSCAVGGSLDCNDNGLLDECEVLAGTTPDVNGNGIPDECECLGDVDGDGAVGVTDFLQLLAEWGPCGGCAADLDGDGEVSVTDFLSLLADWGPCP